MYWTQNVCFDFPYNVHLKRFSFYEEVSEIWWKMYTDLHVKYPLFFSDFNETWIFWTDFPKMLVVACRRTDTTKLIVPFCNFVNTSKNRWTQHQERTRKSLQMVLQLCQKTVLPISGSLAGGIAAVFTAHRQRACLSASLSDLYPTHTEMLLHLMILHSSDTPLYEVW